MSSKPIATKSIDSSAVVEPTTQPNNLCIPKKVASIPTEQKERKGEKRKLDIDFLRAALKEYVEPEKFLTPQESHKRFKFLKSYRDTDLVGVYTVTVRDPSPNDPGNCHEKTMVVKVYHLSHCQAIREFLKELKFYKNFSHSNIPKYDYYVDINRLYLLLDHCEGGTVWTNAKKKGLREEVVKSIADDALNVLAWMHEKKYVHGDIKPENIVLSKKEGVSKAYVIDFGQTMQIEPNECRYKSCGTWEYFSPERTRRNYPLSGEEWRKADLWALGIVLFESLVGKRWFDKLAESDPNFNLVEAIREFRPHFSTAGYDISPECQEFISKLLTHDPKHRPSAAEMLKDPWFAQTSGSIRTKPRPYRPILDQAGRIQDRHSNMMTASASMETYTKVHIKSNSSMNMSSPTTPHKNSPDLSSLSYSINGPKQPPTPSLSSRQHVFDSSLHVSNKTFTSESLTHPSLGGDNSNEKHFTKTSLVRPLS